MDKSSSSQVVVTYLYPRTSTSHFDLSYYLTHHIPTCKRLWEPLGLKAAYVGEIDNDKQDYAVQTMLIWRDRGSWDETSTGPTVQQLVDDVKNFTDVTPVMIVSKIVG
jgi:uncharacterized protein (TIGR02118 family)